MIRYFGNNPTYAENGQPMCDTDKVVAKFSDGSAWTMTVAQMIERACDPVYPIGYLQVAEFRAAA